MNFICRRELAESRQLRGHRDITIDEVHCTVVDVQYSTVNEQKVNVKAFQSTPICTPICDHSVPIESMLSSMLSSRLHHQYLGAETLSSCISSTHSSRMDL
jgi:hypothetical protein